jgi:hypothetical protein
MNDVVGEAADVIVPLLSMGAGAAARDLAERGGVQLAESVSAILSRLRARLSGRAPARADVESALQAALAEGEMADDDLRMLISLRHTVGGAHVQGEVHAKNAFIGTTEIKGDFHA